VRVHLIGSYTPLPNTVGGQLVATIAGETVDRWPTEDNGAIDRWLDVPDRLLHRYTTLSVQVNISGNTGRCGEFQPITLTIDGESVVQTVAAKPPVPQGFQAIPQDLMPRVQVGIGSDAYADTVRAVLIMTGLQRLSALPIDTVVVPLQEAIDTPNPAVLIAPEGWNHPELPLKVKAPDTVPMTLDVVDDDGNPTTLTLDPALKFGSLQTFFDGKRSVLVATSNGDAGELDQLLNWLQADERRWSVVDGLGLIAAPGRDPVLVPIETSPQEGNPAADRPHPNPWWWVGGGLLAVVAAGSAWFLLRSRRKTSSD
jgi:hypothetical protein